MINEVDLHSERNMQDNARVDHSRRHRHWCWYPYSALDLRSRQEIRRSFRQTKPYYLPLYRRVLVLSENEPVLITPDRCAVMLLDLANIISLEIAAAALLEAAG